MPPEGATGGARAHHRALESLYRSAPVIGDARLIDADGEEAARGTGTFMRSQIALSSLPGYRTT